MDCTSIKDLLTGETTRCAALTVAAIAFVLGALVTCLVCKFTKCRGTCAAKNASAAKPQPAKFERREPRHDKPEKRHPAPADGSIEIYVGNLSYDLTDDQLRKAFEAYGKVNYARIITNKFNGKSKGFGFVHMPDPKEVEAALAGLDDKELMGRRLKCNVAKNVD